MKNSICFHRCFMKQFLQYGFTVVELMIGVGIVAILSSIAIPGYLEARNFGLRSAYASELRATSDAFVQFVNERNTLPATTISGIPNNMESYLPKKSTWLAGPDIGGRWAWLNMNTFTGSDISSWNQYRGWIVTLNMPIKSEHVAKLDSLFDDGNSNTGIFRFSNAGSDKYNIYYGVN